MQRHSEIKEKYALDYFNRIIAKRYVLKCKHYCDVRLLTLYEHTLVKVKLIILHNTHCSNVELENILHVLRH